MAETAETSPDDGSIGSIPPLEPTEGKQPLLGRMIADRVREAIIDGRLKPGMAVRQEALAQQLGTSRIPVREALRQLETEGMVTLVPHSGARVARLDMSEHVELYRMREALEPLAIAESAKRLSEEQLGDLRDLANLIEASRGDWPTWIRHDRAFHLLSYAAAPFPRLLQLIDGFWNTTQHYRRAHVSAFDAHTFDVVHMEHRLILDALERHDSDDAQERQRSHIRRTRLELTARAQAVFGEPVDDRYS